MAQIRKKMAALFQSRLVWILAGLVPLISFTAVMLLLFVQQQDKAIENILRESAGNAAYMVERAIGEQVGLLRGLAASRSLDNGDFGEFRAEAQRLWDMHPEWRTVILTDARQAVFNLYFPPGEPIPPLRDSASLKIVRETQKIFLGDLVNGYTALRIPVIRGNRMVYTLVAPINPVFFKDALKVFQNGGHRGFIIAGSDGVVVTASNGAPVAKGERLPDHLFGNQGRASASSGMMLSAPAPISTGNWRVIVFDAVASIEAPYIKKRIAVLLGGGASVLLAFLIVALLSSAWAARQKAMHSLTHMKALNEARIRQNEAIRAANVALWDWDLEKNRVQYSSEWKRQIGYDDGEIGDDIKELENRIHPEDLRSILEIIRGGTDTGDDRRVEFRLRHKDGSYRWILGHASVVADANGRPMRMIGSHLDITGLKRSEASLRESEQRFRTVADYTYDWEYWIGPDGRFIYVSPSCQRITGYTPDDFFQDPSLMEKIVHPEDAAVVQEHAQKAGSSDAPLPIDFRIIAKEGGVRWINHLCQAVYDPEGRYLGKRGSNRDITLQKKLQRESMKAHHLASIATLAGGVAHQFNNALSVIIGNLELLEEDAAGIETLTGYVAEIKDSAERMAVLTAHLLAYARGGRYQAEALSLGDFIAEAIAFMEYKIGPDIELETSFEGGQHIVEADKPQIQMLLSSLLHNAVEAIDGKGRIKITLRRVEGIDKVDGQAPGRKAGPHVCLTVSDNGRGMEEEIRNRIFEPFFTTKFDGRGLGMAAAYGIVRNHNGAISVESGQGRGTSVFVFLPLVEPTEGKNRRQTTPTKAQPRQGTILLVEDEPGVMGVCRTMLTRMGYKVLEAPTASAALDTAREYKGVIDLALLDVLMPDMRGDDLFPRLKDLRPEMKVVINSGFSLEGPACDMMEAGADAFIQKPFTQKDLSKILDETLQ